MGLLRALDGRLHALGGRTVLGRSDDADLPVRDPRVSGMHAAIRWRDGAWRVRDLGSRNGTFVDGRVLGPGETVALAVGGQVALASPELAWTLVDAAGPAPRAIVGDRRVDGNDALLQLPDGDRPEASIYRREGRWWLERGDAEEAIADGAIVEVAGAAWRLELPPGRAETPTLGLGDAPALRFRVSADEEYVEVDVLLAARVVTLRPRSFHYLLLTLARLRLDGDGWTTRAELAHMLRLEPKTIDVAIHRARGAVGAEVPALGGALFETRSRTGQVRLGPKVHSITRL
jgi:hypothetical protein